MPDLRGKNSPSTTASGSPARNVLIFILVVGAIAFALFELGGAKFF